MWVEARLHPDRTPDEVYHWLDDPPEWFHHFWDEPWWPGAFVIRLEGVQGNVRECPAIHHLVLWDEGSDRALFRDWFPWALDFFRSGSMLAEVTSKDRAQLGKLVHCHLNAQGMTVMGEARFALGFAWERLRMQFRIWTRRP